MNVFATRTGFVVPERKFSKHYSRANFYTPGTRDHTAYRATSDAPDLAETSPKYLPRVRRARIADLHLTICYRVPSHCRARIDRVDVVDTATDGVALDNSVAHRDDGTSETEA